jgi:hypothetical protein
MLLILQYKMGGAFGNVGEKEMHESFLWENLKEGDHLEDTDADDKILLKSIQNKSDGGGGGRTGLHLFGSG